MMQLIDLYYNNLDECVYPYFHFGVLFCGFTLAVADISLIQKGPVCIALIKKLARLLMLS